MKDATGELSMTAIAVVAIAAIGVVFTTLIWPTIRENIKRNTYCSQHISCNECDGTTCVCTYLEEDGVTTGTVRCPDQNTQ